MAQREGPNRQDSAQPVGGADDAVKIVYYTDPLCCWSWAMEPHWRRLCEIYGHRLRITYKMGGLLPSWAMYNDARNSIQRPVHMGPEWMHARNTTGVYIDHRIWVTDPPASSFPACIGVKSAGIQGEEYGARYLLYARKAIMEDGRNIARLQVLLELAADLARIDPGFDYDLFRKDLYGRGSRPSGRIGERSNTGG